MLGLQDDSSQVAYSAAMASQPSELPRLVSQEAEEALAWLDSGQASSMPDMHAQLLDEDAAMEMVNRLYQAKVSAAKSQALLVRP